MAPLPDGLLLPLKPFRKARRRQPVGCRFRLRSWLACRPIRTGFPDAVSCSAEGVCDLVQKIGHDPLT